MYGILIFLTLGLASSLRASGTPQQPSTNAVDATTTECVPYEEDLVESNLSSFPPIWEKASIIDGDRDAQATYAAIKGNIPDISVKGGGGSDISDALKSYPDDDPDCWWSFNQCTNTKYPGLPDDVSFVPERKAVQFVTGVTPTCWRPPFGDTDDRIRFIAHSLNLVTILWQYDTFDWKGGRGDAQVDAEVDANYADIVALAANGAFDNVGAIVLMHELSTFTMSKAMEHYPDLKRVFDHILPVGAAVNTTSSNDLKRSIPYQYSWTGVGGPYDPYYGLSGYPNSGVSLRTSRQDIADVLWVMCVGFSVFLLIFRVV
ncbi:hypothetical protein EYR40_002287 [Pleurotus pulmonarius]|nr:hypothetical protein EYR40_002287 [Pleurotus pulmonarius]